MHAKQHLALVLVYNLGKATRFSRRYRLLVAAMDTRTIGATSNRSTIHNRHCCPPVFGMRAFYHKRCLLANAAERGLSDLAKFLVDELPLLVRPPPRQLSPQEENSLSTFVAASKMR